MHMPSNKFDEMTATLRKLADENAFAARVADDPTWRIKRKEACRSAAELLATMKDLITAAEK